MATLVLLTSCLVDDKHPCDANETVMSGDFAGCVCEEGAVLNAAKDGCDKCGENEAVVKGACLCKPGFARVTAGGVCTQSLLGASCTGASGCAGEFPYCAPGGYCSTSGCTANAGCPATYACETTASPAYCSRPPTGQSDSCDATKVCSGEADYCAMGSCVVSGCATTKTCHGDWACCDYSQFGLKDFCIGPTSLVGGKCPGTNADPVKR